MRSFNVGIHSDQCMNRINSAQTAKSNPKSKSTSMDDRPAADPKHMKYPGGQTAM
jgi:hypothetical protein